MKQTNIFDFIMKKYQIQKKIRLISLFSGVGFQEMALRDLGLDFEMHKTCEWDVHPIASAKAIHKPKDFTNYSEKFSKEELIDKLYDLGISNDGKEPMKLESIKRKNEKWLRQTYNNIKATNNLVNITKVHDNDLEIVDKDKYCYFVTYSFPCQDLSKAGKRKGMEKGSGTRSGTLWEVERILHELKECDNLPDLLLMENVPDVAGTKNIKVFNAWQYALETLGYTNHVMMLNARDFGIPQNRERCFMISILGNYSYTDPNKIPLKLRLKDMLEKEVDERYYLSDEQVKGFELNSEKHKEKITDNFIKEVGSLNLGNNESNNRVYDTEGIAPTLNCMQGGNRQPKILEPIICASRGRNPDNPKSRKSGLETMQMIEINDSGCSNTITTVQKDNLVLLPEEASGIYLNASQEFNSGPLTGLSRCLKAEKHDAGVVIHNRIRKLTSLECWRLMGATDNDFYRAAKVNSNSQLYKQAGNGIVKQVLMAIFSQMIPDDYKFRK